MRYGVLISAIVVATVVTVAAYAARVGYRTTHVIAPNPTTISRAIRAHKVSPSGSPSAPHASLTPAPAASASPAVTTAFPVHSGITATFFYGGEPSSADDNWQAGTATAWCGDWQKCFGGTDSPANRQHSGDWPAGFTPKENPFYVALPCSDFDTAGLRADFAAFARANALFKMLTHDAAMSSTTSLLKNRWVRVTSGTKTVYAQWEDTGPFAHPTDNDCPYVFGGPDAKPSNTFGERAGIDVSPAVKQRLGMDGSTTVSWQFVPETSVPAGPWKQIVTTSGPYWP